jgi:hypothetical protein
VSRRDLREGTCAALLVLLAMGCGGGEAPAPAKAQQPATPAAPKAAAPAPAPTPAPAAGPAAPAAEKPLDAAAIEAIFAEVPSQDSVDLEIAPLIDASNADQWLERIEKEIEAKAK